MEMLESEIRKVHDRAFYEGVKESQWRLWESQANQIIRRLGFRSRSDVRRIADRFGRRAGRALAALVAATGLSLAAEGATVKWSATVGHAVGGSFTDSVGTWSGTVVADADAPWIAVWRDGGSVKAGAFGEESKARAQANLSYLGVYANVSDIPLGGLTLKDTAVSATTTCMICVSLAVQDKPKGREIEPGGPVPEPSSGLLLLIGLAAMAMGRPSGAQGPRWQVGAGALEGAQGPRWQVGAGTLDGAQGPRWQVGAGALEGAQGPRWQVGAGTRPEGEARGKGVAE